MPEGDTILRARNRLAAALQGQRLSVSAPTPRGRSTGVQLLDGRVLDRVDAHGKHLMLVFGDRVLHSHLGMNGAWHVYPKGAQWRRSPRSAWALLGADHHDAVQFHGSTMRVLKASQLALDPTLSRLGPDILAPNFDRGQMIQNLRTTPQQRGIGDALLDQHLLAGIGNIYKSESCFAAAVNPWHKLSELSDAQLGEILDGARTLMLASVATGRENFSIYHHRGACSRCGGQILHRGQGDANRTTWWCSRCQL